MRFEDNEERERSLVECDSHVGQRDRYEIVDVDASRHEFRFRVRRDEGSNEIGSDGQFFFGEIEEGRHLLPTRHLGVRRFEIIEEGVRHRFDRSETGGGSVFEQFCDEIDSIRRSTRSEYLREGVRFDLRELVLHIIRIHSFNLLSRRRAEYLDNLHELIDTRLSWEQRLSQHQFRHHTTRRPDIDVSGVVCRSKDQLGRPVVPRTNIRYIWLSLDENFSTSEIA